VDICRCQIVLVARAAWADDALSSEAPNAQCQRDQHSYQLEKMHLMRWLSNGHQDACSMIQYRKVQTSAYISATTPLCQPFCSLGKIAGANAPTIVASAAGSIGFAQQTNKRPGVLVAMQTRTNSNPATTLWKFSACGGFRFRVGQADERHLTSQHLSAVMSVAQHIQRATIALAGAISNDPARSRGVGARRLANCDEPLAPCSCWGGTSVSHRTRLSHNNNVASTVRYLLTRDYLRRKAQSDAGTRKQIHACHCSMRRSTVSELAARGACKVGCGFGAANAQQTHQLDPISCFSH
jgi:hypothetical protein